MADTNDANGAIEDVVEKYDVLPKMIQHLDRHLIFPLLEDRDDTTENKQLKAELLKGTNMFDYLGKLDADIKGLSQPSKEFAAKREDVIKKRDGLEEQTEKLRGLLEDEAVVSNFRSDKVANLKYLETEHGVTADMVDALYVYGNFLYSCGEYQASADVLYQFRVLVSLPYSLLPRHRH
jgi:translation initiation factor 3 subunit E